MGESISICMPVYNGSKFLSLALDSALAQTYTNIEVIVVDDHSKDESYRIAQYYAQKDARVKVYRNNQNLGLVDNWNECIRRSSGTWIKFLFQDDLLDATCIESLFRAATSNRASHSIVFCQRRYVFEGSVSETIKREYAKLLAESRAILIKEYMSPADIALQSLAWPARNIFGEPPSFLIRRDLFDKVGMFDTRFENVCDLEFWVRAGALTGIYYLPKVLVSFRIHSGSMSHYNNTVKAFRTHYIERTILFWKYCNSADYLALRTLLAEHHACSRLHTQLAIFSRRARLQAEASSDPVYKDELQSVHSQFPEINAQSRNSFFHLALRYLLEGFWLRIWKVGRRFHLQRKYFRGSS